MQFDHYGLGVSGGSAPVEFNVVWSSSDSSRKHTLDNIGGVAVEVNRIFLVIGVVICGFSRFISAKLLHRTVDDVLR